MKDLAIENFDKIDIKKTPITEKELEQMHQLTQSYEVLFSKRAQLYKKLNLKEQSLSEPDFKKYLLQHYTFLKRPVLIDGAYISVGSSPKVQKELVSKYGKAK